MESRCDYELFNNRKGHNGYMVPGDYGYFTDSQISSCSKDLDGIEQQLLCHESLSQEWEAFEQLEHELGDNLNCPVSTAVVPTSDGGLILTQSGLCDFFNISSVPSSVVVTPASTPSSPAMLVPGTPVRPTRTPPSPFLDTSFLQEFTEDLFSSSDNSSGASSSTSDHTERSRSEESNELATTSSSNGSELSMPTMLFSSVLTTQPSSQDLTSSSSQLSTHSHARRDLQYMEEILSQQFGSQHLDENDIYFPNSPPELYSSQEVPEWESQELDEAELFANSDDDDDALVPGLRSRGSPTCGSSILDEHTVPNWYRREE